MENIPAEWFSVQTVREYGGVAAVFYVLGAYSLAFAIRQKWVSLSANVETTVDLAVAKNDIEHRNGEIIRLTDENESLKEQIASLA